MALATIALLFGIVGVFMASISYANHKGPFTAAALIFCCVLLMFNVAFFCITMAIVQLN